MKKIIFIALIVFLFSTPSEAQCAMCRAVLESEEGQGVAKGINDGIIYLMAVPYILIGGLGFLIYKKFNKTKKDKP
ncbi:hypothetical protein [Hanstruepera marina]|uniref:hypothetical protein n=1 Tax=Hanstruepera marina TaxID=2873265 RepID=UPI0021043DBD|nr:hypothetical protein [Hanstruepera marina]